MWKQRSKIRWLQEGNKNTKFFHNKASQRKRKNQVSGLQDEHGLWKMEAGEIERIVESYFTNIFTSSNPPNFGSILDVVETTVTADMNTQLSQTFQAEEVTQALHQMYPTKSPGPDGMPAFFYQRYWHIVGDRVISTVLNTLNSGHMLKKINYTYIALIPKTSHPEKITDYRPISLCNVIYKLVSKVLANRLKIILPHIIHETQSAFVPGRMITDNVLVAFEVMHSLKRKTRGKEGKMALKLDMSKAYDRVEWSFIEAMMHKMGFNETWIKLIMECISTVSSLVLINGEPKCYIQPSRGLRQGDPLSPYLFLLCVEGFSALIRQAQRDQKIYGIRIARQAPEISHLFFADDSILFCQATEAACSKIQELLHIYELTSGQQVNREKTNIYFSKNTTHALQERIKALLGVQVSCQHEKYLGLPSLIGRTKRQVFSTIKARVWKKLQGWKEKMLSKAGKGVLIKAIAQAIPTYAMGVFKLPVSLCKELNSIVAGFWWGTQENDRGIHWIKWKTLCDRKERGGLGFRNLIWFNQAMLAKMGWRMIQDPNSLAYRVLKARYFPSGEFMTAQVKPGASYAWRSIAGARHVLEKGVDAKNFSTV
jgi:hypothetical protein